MLIRDAGEEGGKTCALGLGPGIDARAHESEGDGMGDGGGIAALNRAVEVGGRDAEVTAGRGEEGADEAVVRHVVADRIVEPLVVGLNGVGPEIDRELGLDAEDVAPLEGPEIGKFGAGEEEIDQDGALVGRAVLEEVVSGLGVWDGADEVDVDAAEEDFVGAGGSGIGVEAMESGGDGVVEGCGGGGWRGKGGDGRLGDGGGRGGGLGCRGLGRQRLRRGHRGCEGRRDCDKRKDALHHQ